jgi:type IV secretory pathway TraG/TraD family ATPase VirD4
MRLRCARHDAQSRAMSLATTFLATHVRGLLVVYALAALGLCAGLIASAASARRLLSVPIMAIPVAAVGAAAWLLARTVLKWPVDLGSDPMTPIALLAGGLGAIAGIRPPRSARPDAVRRGTRIARAKRRWRWIAAADSLELAGQTVPAGDEAKHFKIIGTTGTGKTTAIRGLLGAALARGDSAVIADPDGAYLDAFHDSARGDLILSPFDTRSCRWDLLAELSTAADADHLARALIADQPGEDRTWRSYARVLTAAVLRQAYRAGIRDLASLHHLLMHAPAEELEPLLQTTPAAAYLSPDNARFFASVRAIASTQLAALDYLEQPVGGAPLAIRAWIRDRLAGRSSVLFLPYRASQLAVLRTILSTWVRLAIFETMDVGTGERPIWFVVDELDALGAIDGLKDALARLRKYGGRCVLGFQSMAQVTGTYGAHDAQTIIENCGTTLVLRCSSSGQEGTAQFASKLIGDREVMREQVTRSRRGPAGGGPPQRSVVVQQVTERAVLAAQIEQLPDLAGYLKFASAAEWRQVEVRSLRP